MTVRVLIGDVFDRLRELPADHFDCVVTSPPYWGLRDYGVEGQLGLEPTLGEHIDVMVRVFAEVHRVMKPTGTLWLNYGDCYATKPNGRSAADTKAAGNDDRTFRDKPFDTTGAIYRPGYEKTPRGDDENFGSLASQHGGRIVGYGPILKPKDLCMIPNRLAIALQEWGWWVRSEIVWAKPNPMPESIKDRPATSHEKIFMLSKSARYFYAADDVRQDRAGDEDANTFRGGSYVGGEAGPRAVTGNKRVYKTPDGWDTGAGGHSSRHRNGREKGESVAAKLAKQEQIAAASPDVARAHQVAGFNERWDASEDERAAGRSLRNWEPAALSAWVMGTAPFKDAHFATFPPELVERCLKAGCPKGGRVLDPFGGAGTTALVADQMQLDATIIELNPDYVHIAVKRIEADRGDLQNALDPLVLFSSDSALSLLEEQGK